VVSDDEERPVKGRRAVPAKRRVVGVAADDRRAYSGHERVEDLAALVGERLGLVAPEEPGIQPARLTICACHVAVERDRVDAEDDAHAASYIVSNVARRRPSISNSRRSA
jgi:hypothetical protein